MHLYNFNQSLIIINSLYIKYRHSYQPKEHSTQESFSLIKDILNIQALYVYLNCEN